MQFYFGFLLIVAVMVTFTFATNVRRRHGQNPSSDANDVANIVETLASRRVNQLLKEAEDEGGLSPELSEKIKPLIVDAVAMMVDEALAAEDMEEEDEDQNAENDEDNDEEPQYESAQEADAYPQD